MKFKRFQLLIGVLLCLVFTTTQTFARFDISGNPTLPSKWSNNNLSTLDSSHSCNDSIFALAPGAADCNGVSVTPLDFANTGRVLESGTDNTVGAIYRYPNAGVAPDGTNVDIRVTVQSYNNTQDPDENTIRDTDSTAFGFADNLQPNLQQEPGQFINNGPWNAQITYLIEFLEAGTNNAIPLTVAPTSIDNDGANNCGGLQETVTYGTENNQVLVNTPGNTSQVPAGNSVTPNSTANQGGIGVGSGFASAGLFVNVTQFTWSYSFASNGNCNVGGNSAGRLGSLNLSCQIDFDQDFATVPLSGNVFNDIDGLNDGSVDGTNAVPGGLFANLLDSNGNVVASVPVNPDGSYSFPAVVPGDYNVQISTNQGVESSAAPAQTLPAGWVSTGENLGSGSGDDGTVDGLLPVTVGDTPVTDANFGIEEPPVADDNTAAPQNNFGGTNNGPVPPTTFSGSDPSSGTITSIRITDFPSNATSITINGVLYTAATFPAGGVTVPTDSSGNPTQAISVDPIDGPVTVVIPYVTTDDAGIESPPANASVPFIVSPTAAESVLSGQILVNQIPLANALVLLSDISSDSVNYTRTNADGVYSFEAESGNSYIVQAISNKYEFAPANRIVNLVEDLDGVTFTATNKLYRPKNDFDGDGRSDIAVYRASEGNWYVLNSGNGEISVFNFGLESDKPVSADYDGDGKTDYAVYRPSEGNWYIWKSSDSSLLVERFGLANDKLVQSDYDADGKADVAVYRDGIWYIKNSSDGEIQIFNFGLDSDVSTPADYDGDGKTDIAVYRPSTGIWFILQSSNSQVAYEYFGIDSDLPLPADFDGDGRADIAQFRNGDWYFLNSIEGFNASQLGESTDKSIVGDFDGDGRSDQAVYSNGVWTIRNSANGSIDHISFGLPTDIPIN